MSLSEGENRLWAEFLEQVPDVAVEMDPVELRVPFVIESVAELVEAVDHNHVMGLIDDNQRDIALGFCENLRLTERPEAEIAELTIQEVDGEMKLWLCLPGTRS